MKLQKLIFLATLLSFLAVGCKNKTEKTQEKEVILTTSTQNISLHISGMTCEIGCAKYIQSKLHKQAGVLNAKVIFTDSIANIEFEANDTSKSILIAFVNGLAGGEMYQATGISSLVEK
jgi:copper chaperone CopZ